MNKPKLSVFIGLPGSSVTEQAMNYAAKEQCAVCSMTKESIDQMIELLKKGESVVVVAKLYKLVSRSRFLSIFTEIECEKECHLVVETYNKCLENSTQEELSLVYNYFVLPWYYEGWDAIHVIKTEEEVSSINNLLYNEKTGLVCNDITVKGSNGKEIQTDMANFSLRCYNAAKVRGLNHRILKSLLLMYASGTNNIESTNTENYYVGILRNPYESLFYSQIDEVSDELLRIINDGDVLDDLYIAILIQWGEIFSEFVETEDVFRRIHNLFGKSLCQDLLDRQEVIQYVTDIIVDLSHI